MFIRSAYALPGNSSFNVNKNNQTTVNGWKLDQLMTVIPQHYNTFSSCIFAKGFYFENSKTATVRVIDVSIVVAEGVAVHIKAANALQSIFVNQTMIHMRGLVINNVQSSQHQQQCGIAPGLLSVSGYSSNIGSVICESCRFLSNEQQCILVTDGAKLELQECLVSKNIPSCTDKSPIQVQSGATLSVLNSTFMSNEAFGASGVIEITGARTLLNIDKSTFVSNRARNSNGGAVAVYAGAQVLISNNSRFSKNQADFYGGAIYVTGTGSILIARSNTLFSGNIGREGGAVSAIGIGVQVILQQSHVVENNNAFRGGGCFVGDNAKLILDQSTVHGNQATNGGAVFVAVEGNVNVSSSSIHGKSATVSGGALEARTQSNTVFFNTSVHGNTAPKGAGVVLTFASNLIVHKSEISRNIETSLHAARWWENSGAGQNAAGIDCASGSSIMVDADSKVELNEPYNVACDSDCVVSGLNVACLATPLVITK
jgi:predicted outer membrane repeat protein